MDNSENSSALSRLRKPHQNGFAAFAMIVDINDYETMVKEGFLIADFTRDVLSGAIAAIETVGGDVVGIMGDAILAILDDAEATGRACFQIANDLDRQCDYISAAQRAEPSSWDFAPGGPGLKIGIEFGHVEESTIHTRFVKEQTLFSGVPIVHAHRILEQGIGNRCFVGPQAAVHWPYPLEGPIRTEPGKRKAVYEYYRFDLGDIWKEGEIPKGDSRSWR